MQLRKTTGLIALAIAVALPLVAAPPASATVTGSVTFRCSSTLEWPTSFGTGACGDSLARGVVALAGEDTNGLDYSVHGVGSFWTTFHYQVICVANEPGLAAFFQGTGTVSGVPAVHDGVVTTADVSFRFTWIVGGVVGPITVDQWTVRFTDGGSAAGTLGAGSASFVPLHTVGNTCPSPGGVMQAQIAGKVTAVL